MPYFNNISIHKRSTIVWKALFLLIGLIAFIIIVNFFNNQVKNFFYHISSPVEKRMWNVNSFFSASVGSVFQSSALLKENYELKNKNQQLLSEVLSLQATKKANDALNEIRANPEAAHFNLSMASIIGSDEEGMILINKGSDDGLVNNMPVINKQNILVGKVENVYKDFAKVMLLSDKRSTVNIKIKNDQADSKNPEVVGLLRGGGDANMYIDLVAIDSQIAKDTVIVTSSLEKTFPKDLLIGKITDVKKDSQKPFQQANVSPFFNIGITDFLFIITNYHT